MNERIKDYDTGPDRLALSNLLQLIEVADLYANVFAGDPWNEYSKCSCDTFYGKDSCLGESCPCGKSLLTQAYPLGETMEYIKKECTRKDAKSFVQKDTQSGDMIGFTWGYIIDNPSEFAVEKYKTDKMRQTVISTLARNNITDRFFYFSEIGVREDKRGQGLSNILSKKLIDAARWENVPIVMRTNSKSPLMAVARMYQMTQVLGPEITILSEAGQKSIQQTGRFINNIIDTENGDRVLFVLK